MRRFGQVIKLIPEKADEYIKYHASVWPGVLKMIKECNISNYSIFFNGFPTMMGQYGVAGLAGNQPDSVIMICIRFCT